MERQGNGDSGSVSSIPKLTVVINKLNNNQIDLDATKNSISNQTYKNAKIVVSENYIESVTEEAKHCDVLCLICAGDELYSEDIFERVMDKMVVDEQILYGDTCVLTEGIEKVQYLPPFDFKIINSGYFVVPIFVPSKHINSINIKQGLKFLASHDIISKLANIISITHMPEKLFKVPVREIDIKEDIEILNEAQ